MLCHMNLYAYEVEVENVKRRDLGSTIYMNRLLSTTYKILSGYDI